MKETINIIRQSDLSAKTYFFFLSIVFLIMSVMLSVYFFVMNINWFKVCYLYCPLFYMGLFIVCMFGFLLGGVMDEQCIRSS